jgi:hypothetical protein
VDAVTVEAYRQKDKLLTFDREHAKRTHVNDAQSDYYESSTWLSDAEKADLDRKEQLRRDAAKPSNRRYKMSFDLAGRRVVEVVRGDEEEPTAGPAASASKGGEGRYDAGYEPDQLLQNDSLMSEGAGRIGDVYRQIRNKFADRAAAAAAAAATGTTTTTTGGAAAKKTATATGAGAATKIAARKGPAEANEKSETTAHAATEATAATTATTAAALGIEEAGATEAGVTETAEEH